MINKELLEQLKNTSSDIEKLLGTLSLEYYDKISKGGNIWTGDAAEIAKETFENLVTKYSIYNKKIEKYIEETLE